MRKRLLWQLGVVLFFFGFKITFSVFYSIFSRLSAGYQVLMAPVGPPPTFFLLSDTIMPLTSHTSHQVWPVIKIGYKALDKYALHKGRNPDSVPMIGFTSDLTSAMCGTRQKFPSFVIPTIENPSTVILSVVIAGNLLFAVCTDVRSVMVIVAVEGMENMVMTVKALLYFQADEVNNIKHRQNDQPWQKDIEELRKKVEEQDEVIKLLWNENKKHYLELDRHLQLTEDACFRAPDLPSSATRQRFANIEAALLSDDLDGGLVIDDVGANDHHADGCSIELNRGISLILNMALSEFGEILCAFWSLLIQAGLYYSKNKNYFDGIRDMDLEDLQQTMYFSAIDCGTQSVVSVVLLVFIKLYTTTRTLAVLQCYWEEIDGFAFSLASAILAPTIALAFFEAHAGVDPSFSFEWLDAGNSTILGRPP
jgi:hypothetical protein